MILLIVCAVVAVLILLAGSGAFAASAVGAIDSHKPSNGSKYGKLAAINWGQDGHYRNNGSGNIDVKFLSQLGDPAAQSATHYQYDQAPTEYWIYYDYYTDSYTPDANGTYHASHYLQYRAAGVGGFTNLDTEQATWYVC